MKPVTELVQKLMLSKQTINLLCERIKVSTNCTQGNKAASLICKCLFLQSAFLNLQYKQVKHLLVFTLQLL